MVFLGLVHIPMTVPNRVFLFMRSLLVLFDFCLSYRPLIRFSALSAYTGGGGKREEKDGRKNRNVVEKAQQVKEMPRE
jgi:hypothetical protein